MSKFIITCSCLTAIVVSAAGQEMNMNKVTLADLRMTKYDRDTSANAVVLDEWGKTHLSSAENEYLVFEHYLKIKILTKKGTEQANYEIVLDKSDKDSERLLSAEGATYNLEKGVKVVTELNSKSIFTSDPGKYRSVVKFALPSVKVGSVIEIMYKTNSPFAYNYHGWEFQSDIPKVHSEYWASVPAVFVYHASLRGLLELTKNESSLEEDCYEPGGGNKASCTLTKFAMDNVPAFVEEDYMTAKSNFLSAIRYELAEVHEFNGLVKKVTKEWKDADAEMKKSDGFGSQLKKAENDMEGTVKGLIASKLTPLEKAKTIFEFIRQSFDWNEHNGIFTEFGIRKAWEQKKGNDADINLMLVGALRAAGLEANPVILSTRSNGTPVELYPVISEFNYVVAALSIDGKLSFMDATSKLHSFGFLPLRCVNGKGRLMSQESSWVELKAKDKRRTITTLDLTLQADGTLIGKVIISAQGFAALYKRADIIEARDTTEYKENLKKKMKDMEIVSYQSENVNDLDKPLIERMTVKFTSLEVLKGQTIYFNPFIFDRLEENPFKQTERLYPIDYGSAQEAIVSLTLKHGPEYEVDEVPANTALMLPRNGGKFLLNASQLPNQVTVTSSLSISKAIYNPSDYPFLKELYARIVQSNQSPIVLKRK